MHPCAFRPQTPSSSAMSLQAECTGNDACIAMRQLCPGVRPADQYTRTPCGGPFPHLQPDGYVNEEWCVCDVLPRAGALYLFLAIKQTDLFFPTGVTWY